MMKITDLLVTAEEVETGKKIMGYVCGYKLCSTASPGEKYDHSRPIGFLVNPDENCGVRVYTDTLELVNNH